MKNETNTTKRAGGEKRGNSADRRRSRHNLLRHWGDGHKCGCVYCGRTLWNWETVEKLADGRKVWENETTFERVTLPHGMTPTSHVTRDRIVPADGYVMKNLVPACFTCNGDASNTEWADRWADDPQYGTDLAAYAASYRRKG